MIATDGELGSISDFLFDDESWHVRYVVVGTRSILPGRQVLISPVSIRRADGITRQVGLTLTREQVRSSPGVDADLPVSRQVEKELASHYDWPVYWSPYDVPAPAFSQPGTGVVERTRQRQAGHETHAEVHSGDVHLRSAREVISYYIKATDGEIGHVEDFIVDDEGWVVRYMVVDTRNWLPGRKVLVAPGWIRSIDWHEKWVNVNLDQESIKTSPPFDPSAPINREYEVRLYDFYGRPSYWEQ